MASNRTRGVKNDYFEAMTKFQKIMEGRAGFTKVSELATEMGVADKSIRNYIKALEDHGYIFERKHSLGIRMVKSMRFGIQERLSDDEKLALKIIKEHVKKEEGLMSSDVKNAFDKLQYVLGKDHDISILENDIPYAHQTQCNPEAVKEQEWSKTILKGIQAEDQFVSMKYSSINESERHGKKRKVIPLALVHVKGNHYMDAWCMDSKLQKRYKLTRMEDLKLHSATPKEIEEMKQLRESFVLKDDLEHNLGAYEADPERIKIHIIHPVSKIVGEKIIHRDQKIEWSNDGSILFEAEIGKSPSLVAWVLGMGRYAKVIEGEWLIEQLKCHVNEMNAYLKG